MHRFWTRYSKPLVEALAPQRIMEIGAANGVNSRHLLEYSARSGAKVDILERDPDPALREVVEALATENCTLHEGERAALVADLETPDLALLSGEANWRTVFGVLSMLSTRACLHGRTMPVVLVHSCGWPYARRDMYQNPMSLRDDRRHAFAYRGVLPGVSALVDDGIEAHRAHALTEGGPENGVLTAVEDFLAVTPGMRLWTMPVLGGLAIIAPEERLSGKVIEVIQQFFRPEALMEICLALELSTNRARAEMAEQRRELKRCSEALDAARKLFAERARHLQMLRNRRS